MSICRQAPIMFSPWVAQSILSVNWLASVPIPAKWVTQGRGVPSTGNQVVAFLDMSGRLIIMAILAHWRTPRRLVVTGGIVAFAALTVAPLIGMHGSPVCAVAFMVAESLLHAGSLLLIALGVFASLRLSHASHGGFFMFSYLVMMGMLAGGSFGPEPGSAIYLLPLALVSAITAIAYSRPSWAKKRRMLIAGMVFFAIAGFTSGERMILCCLLAQRPDVICAQECFGEHHKDLLTSPPGFQFFGLANPGPEFNPTNAIFFSRDRFDLVSAGGF